MRYEHEFVTSQKAENEEAIYLWTKNYKLSTNHSKMER